MVQRFPLSEIISQLIFFVTGLVGACSPLMRAHPAACYTRGCSHYRFWYFVPQAACPPPASQFCYMDVIKIWRSLFIEGNPMVWDTGPIDPKYELTLEFLWH